MNSTRCIRRDLTAAALRFYQNRHLEFYAARPANRLTLRQLVFASVLDPVVFTVA
jgi:hypothetical protein